MQVNKELRDRKDQWDLRENVEQRETKGIREGGDQVVFVVPLDPLGQ